MVIMETISLGQGVKYMKGKQTMGQMILNKFLFLKDMKNECPFLKAMQTQVKILLVSLRDL